MIFTHDEMIVLEGTKMHWKDIWIRLRREDVIYKDMNGVLCWASDNARVKCYSQDSPTCRKNCDRQGNMSCIKCPYFRYYGRACDEEGGHWLAFAKNPSLKTSEALMESLEMILEVHEIHQKRVVELATLRGKNNEHADEPALPWKSIMIVARKNKMHQQFEKMVIHSYRNRVMIIHAYEPVDAFAHLFSKKIDLVITEDRLCDTRKNGHDLVNAIKSLLPGLPVIVLSMTASKPEHTGDCKPDAVVEATDLNRLLPLAASFISPDRFSYFPVKHLNISASCQHLDVAFVEIVSRVSSQLDELTVTRLLVAMYGNSN